MKNLIKRLRIALYLVLATVLLVGCNYTERTKIEFDRMAEPVTLHYKEKITFWHSVVLKDGNGHYHRFGNSSALANYIGDNYQIGDTIPKIVVNKAFDIGSY